MPDEAGPTQRLSLSVPAGAEHIGTVRAFIGSVGAHFGLPQDQVDDLRLAVSEICGDPSRWTGDGRIHVRVAETVGALDVEIAGLGDASFSEAAGADGALAFRRRLIDALIPDATFTTSDEGMAVRFAVRASG